MCCAFCPALLCNGILFQLIACRLQVTGAGADDDMFEEPNKCYSVWNGLVAKPAFADFRVHKCGGDTDARQLMAERGVAQYWDAAQFFVPTIEAAAT